MYYCQIIVNKCYFAQRLPVFTLRYSLSKNCDEYAKVTQQLDIGSGCNITIKIVKMI